MGFGSGVLSKGNGVVKMPLIVATYVSAAAKGQCMHSNRTKNSPLPGCRETRLASVQTEE
jgi:hypothetical protein